MGSPVHKLHTPAADRGPRCGAAWQGIPIEHHGAIHEAAVDGGRAAAHDRAVAPTDPQPRTLSAMIEGTFGLSVAISFSAWASPLVAICRWQVA
jgi:hypothetical protein